MNTIVWLVLIMIAGSVGLVLGLFVAGAKTIKKENEAYHAGWEDAKKRR